MKESRTRLLSHPSIILWSSEMMFRFEYDVASWTFSRQLPSQQKRPLAIED